MSSSADFGEPYFTTRGAFALDPQVLTGRTTRRVATFVPDHTLLYADRDQLATVLDNTNYKTFITQHGERLLIRTAYVSPDPLSRKYGMQTIIFHDDSYMCDAAEPDCDADSDNAIDIRRGDVLQRVTNTPSVDGIVKLRTVIEGRPQDGVLQQNVFERQAARAVFTDSSLPHPRFLVEDVTTFRTLGTACGEVRKTVNAKRVKAELTASVEPGGWITTAARLSQLFNLNFKLEAGAAVEKSGTVETEYGDPAAALDFKRIRIRAYDKSARSDPSSDVRTFFVITRLRCLGEGPSAYGSAPIFVDHVTILEGDSIIARKPFAKFYPQLKLDADLTEDSVPYRVYRLNGNRPFLTSINGRQAYTRALDIWRDQLGDTSLAVIFLGMFNASCPDKTVSGSNQRQDCNDLLRSAN